MLYTRNSMHPTALYLSSNWWMANLGTMRVPPPPIPKELAGIERIRVCLPEGVPPPDGWQRRKETSLGALQVSQPAAMPLTPDADVRKLARRGQDFARWVELHTAIYRREHADNPVANLTPREAARIFAGPDLHPDGILAAYHNGRLAGISSLRTGPDEALDLGWTGVTQEAPNSLILDLVTAAVGTARDLGAETLGIEVDDTDAALSEALKAFPILWTERHLTFEAVADAEMSF